MPRLDTESLAEEPGASNEHAGGYLRQLAQRLRQMQTDGEGWRTLGATAVVQLVVSSLIGVSMWAHEARNDLTQWMLLVLASVALVATIFALRSLVMLLRTDAASSRAWIWPIVASLAPLVAGVAINRRDWPPRVAESFVLVVGAAVGPIGLELAVLRHIWPDAPARRRRLFFNAILLMIVHLLLVGTLRPHVCVRSICNARDNIWLGASIAGVLTLIVTSLAGLMTFDLAIDRAPDTDLEGIPKDSAHALGMPIPDGVRAREDEWIAARAAALHASTTRVGLALSGGGIRSTAVCLGVIARLAENRRLRHIHYVSSVSGGGWAAAAILARLATPAASAAGRRSFQDNNLDEHSPFIEQPGVVRNYIDDVRQNREYLLRGPLRLSAEAIRPAILVAMGAGIQFALDVLLATAIVSIAFHINQILPKTTERSVYDTALARVVSPVYCFTTWTFRSVPGVRHLAVVAPHLYPLKATLDAVVVAIAIFVAVALLCLGMQLLIVVRLRPWSARWSLLGARLLRLVAALWLLLLVLEGEPTLIAVVLAACAGTAGYMYAKLSGARLAVVAAAVFGAAKWLAPHIPALERGINATSTAWKRLIERLIHAVINLDVFVGRIWGNRESEGPLLVAGVCGVLYLVLPMVISRNRIGLHAFWRERLSEAFMQTSGERIGDVALHLFQPDKAGRGHGSLAARAGWPYPIFNGAINVPASLDSEVRASQVARFEMTPFYIGGPLTGWAKTSAFGSEVTLASAVAISSAAVNTQGGASIPGSLRPIFATLNFRLGAWLRNPRAAAGGPAFRRSLHFTTMYAAREWFGRNDELDGQILVSDGGHDDNLGIAALVARGCEVVLCVDAAADPHWHFRDLATTVRALRRHGWDFEGDVRTEELRPPSADDASKSRLSPRLAVTIRLKHVDGRRVTLLYAKSGLTAATPWDVREYGRAQTAFPQHSTADQFFNLTQFDAYVAVGEELGKALINEWGAHSEPRSETAQVMVDS